jgi:CRISPR-associated endonuclease/helicase Cas3
MKNLLGKSDGTTLKNHSELVSKVSVMIYDTTASYIDDKIRESIRIAGLLHDIGKCTTFFQSKLHDSVLESVIENNQPNKYPFRHNEIGYAFLYNHLYSHRSFDKKLILDAVYWHHGVTPDNFKKSTPIYNNPIIISPEDSDTMIGFAADVLNESLISIEPSMVVTNFNRPDYFVKFEDLNDDTNQTKLLIRNCIISADRIVSKGLCDDLSDDDILSLITTFNNRGCDIDINTHIYNVGNSERFLNQVSIATSIVNDNTNGHNVHIIKAPAGFGKTLTGLLWNFQRDKRLIWVCPRNDVAQSVYQAILNELKGFNNGSSISMELYLTGEVIERTHDNHGEFDSDIIVTNIDNFLNPSVDNRFSHRLFTVIESDVIFDEYHELVDSAPLFSLFINMMRLRTSMTKSSTVLLSATPSVMEFLWNTMDKKTKVLPNINEHFKPQHDQQYKLNVVNEIQVPSPNTSSVTIFNSVTNAQRFKRASNTPYLYHSLYIPADRKRTLSDIFKMYDKDSPRLVDKPNVCATHVLQASLDISFNHLYESVLSPESTIQRIGRCDRFGDYVQQSTITIFKNVPDGDTGENNIRGKIYSVNLTNMWFDHIKKYDGQSLTLEQLYLIYNQFNTENQNVIKNQILRRFTESSNRLAELYPVKLFVKGKGTVKTAGGNKLRSLNGDEVFVIVRYHNDNDKYSDPISVDAYGNFTETFNESNNQYQMIVNQFKKLRDQNDERFDFNDILEAHKRKALTLDHIRHHAKRENTPYVRFDRVYHPDYGFVDQRILS